MNADAQRHAVLCELVHDVACSAGEVRLSVTGASMLPAVWPGDVVTVRNCNLAEVQPGQIILYRRDGRLTAHRVIRCVRHTENDHLITRGDSLAWFDPPVQVREVVGRVIAISRAGRHIDPEQTSWQRVASSMLRRSDFLLRVTLYLNRRLHRFGTVKTSGSVA